MRKPRVIVLAMWIALTLSNAAAMAESSVWRVEKDGQHLFLAGTIHILSAADYPLPDAFDQAYAGAERIVLEADINAVSTPLFQRALMTSMLYTDGSTLQDILAPATFNRLREFCTNRGIPIMGLNPFKPGMVSMMLTLTELQRMGLIGVGVDLHYYRRGKEDNKQFAFLETLEEQIEFIGSMGEKNPNQFMERTLDDIVKLPELLGAIKEAWRAGDLEKLEKNTLDTFRADYPAVYHTLMVERNQDWLPRIEEMFQTDEVELVMVGTLHLAGEDGILAMLETEGYRVEKLGDGVQE